MFHLHALLDRYADTVRTQEMWRRDGRQDMVNYCADNLASVRLEIEQDILGALRRTITSKPR